ncbi:unnamed protein product, partial [Callosobruchus maculatus]
MQEETQFDTHAMEVEETENEGDVCWRLQKNHYRRAGEKEAVQEEMKKKCFFMLIN